MRHPSDRLAAYVAHLCNDTSGRLDLGKIYVCCLEALANQYASSLLHYHQYAWRMTEDEAAERYFELVFERPVILTGKVKLSVSHILMEKLLRRVPGKNWNQAFLSRGDFNEKESSAALTTVGPLRHLATNLCKESRDISRNSASPTLIKRHGPITIHIGHVVLGAPEELSAWQVLTVVPPEYEPLPIGDEFNNMCRGFIDIFRTTNRVIQEALGLGHKLCPFDWTNDLTINQMRSIRKFLQVKVSLGNDPDSWERAWGQSPVTGFKTFEDFKNSDIGNALSQPQTGIQKESFEDLSHDECHFEDKELLTADELDESLSGLVGNGLLNDTEREIFLSMYSGMSMSEISNQPEFADYFMNNGITIDVWSEMVMDKISNMSSTHGAMRDGLVRS